ncbi:MAG: hypothetical protein HC821_05155 [Lewinella sp.]|nr:hypothetical protein [Lewinella sp.]
MRWAMFTPAEVLQAQDASLLQPRTDAEHKALSQRFAAAPPMSERGDDLRRVAALTDAAKQRVDSARAVVQAVLRQGRKIFNLLDEELTDLPLGISKQIGNITVTLAISEARLTATQAEVDLVLEIDLPDTNQDPIFEARRVGFSRQGGFASEGIDMHLIADWGIDLNAGKSRLIFYGGAVEDQQGQFR